MQEGRALLSEAEEAVSQDRYAAAHAPLASAAAKLRLARDEPGLARVRELEVFQYSLCILTKPLCILTKPRGLARVRDLEFEVCQHFVIYVCTSNARTRSQLQRVN